MILVHEKVSAPLDAGDLSGVRQALQAAIQLEHSTMPPYLYALYSLDPGRNAVVAQILRSVVKEEMAHLALAANILSALGGSPVLDDPALLPRYPSQLPGTVEHGLVVGLGPFSIGLVRDTFLAIEQPEHPLEFAGEDPGGQTDGTDVLPTADGADGAGLTIGQFYRRIAAAIEALGDGAFAPGPRNQVTSGLLPDVIAVTNVATARQAIGTIVSQGEGTSSTPAEVVGTDMAHYYRFLEVVHGRRLVPDLSLRGRYAWGAGTITFDPAGVYPVPHDPRTAGYPAGSPARRACAAFNYSYTCLLKTLHTAFNGDGGQFAAAVGLMMSLQEQAMDMMTGVTTGGIPAGPSFEWQQDADG
jgi:Ferritin-like